MAGLVGTRAGCTSQAASQLGCGVFGITDSALWVDQYNGTSWGGFARLGQTTVGNPSCVALGGGKVLCAIVNVNNKVLCAIVNVNNKVSSTVGP